jgi:crotonobetainyl-CoA:carnitine CoA-transferase CaiB-like acyl-CoA transferase
MTLPLSGLKVLDFSTLLPGPYATQLLADMGAEVLRIEASNRPDLLKMMPPMVGKVSAAHATINRNKKSLAIDLKHPDAKSIIHALVKEYDIVVEQFRPGVMKRLGLDYETLAEINESLIYCSITGYGQTGPLKDRAGHDINYLALSGLASYSGRKETGPILSATQIADIAGGSHHAVMAILAAQIQRSASGKGQYLDISMSDAALALNTMFGAGALAGGRDPSLGTEMLNGGLFYDYYETADGKYLSVGSLEPNFASALLLALGLSDQLSKIADQRPETQTALRASIADKLKAETQAHWVEVFSALDACVEPVLSVKEAAQHPHFVARGMVAEAVDRDGNVVPQIASALPFKGSQTQNKAGAVLGEHTAEALRAAHFSDEQIESLKGSACIRLG